MTRQQVVDNIKDVERAILWTNSPYCRRDLFKYLKRLKRELRDYDRFQQEAANGRA